MLANRNETIVSCTVAHWICAADIECSTALEYYNRYCKSMFHGKKCTHRCLNSISILRRQEKAAKLNTCKCDGEENFDCKRIQSNMAKLCFHRKEVPPSSTTEPAGDVETNVIRKESSSGCGGVFAFGMAVFSSIFISVFVRWWLVIYDNVIGYLVFKTVFVLYIYFFYFYVQF